MTGPYIILPAFTILKSSPGGSFELKISPLWMSLELRGVDRPLLIIPIDKDTRLDLIDEESAAWQDPDWNIAP